MTLASVNGWCACLKAPCAPQSLPVQNASTTLPESLSGLIETVTFHNEDTGFGVLKVKAKGHRDFVTVVGSLASVSAGEWLTAQGHWVQGQGIWTANSLDSMRAIWHQLSRPKIET